MSTTSFLIDSVAIVCSGYDMYEHAKISTDQTEHFIIIIYSIFYD